MEKVVYIILSRVKDSFNIVYVDDCEKTEEKNYFVSNSNFKCWIDTAGSENSLYLAILPMFESNQIARKGIVTKILQRYKPVCNENKVFEKPSDYVVRPKENLPTQDPKEANTREKISCPCCGSEMKVDQVLEKSTILKCTGCGLSDSRLNS